MRPYLNLRTAPLLLFSLMLLLGACAPATDRNEPIYVGSFEVPSVLAESAAENCRSHADAFRRTAARLSEEVKAFDTQVMTGCFKTRARLEKIDRQLSRNAEAAGYTKVALDNPTRPYRAFSASPIRDERSVDKLYIAYRFERTITYVTVAHSKTKFVGFRPPLEN